MSTGFHGNGHEGETQQFGSTTAVHDNAPTTVQDGAPTETLVSSAVGDRCVNCGATLLSDQRYCVVCGERRGAPRFTLPAAATTTTEVTTSSVSRRGGARGPRFGSATTLIAGVGTLLLALLVGFLIGNAASKNNTKTVSAGTPKVTVVNTGGSGAGTGTTAASSGTSTASSSGSKTSAGSHRSKTKASKSTAPKKQAQAESNAAAKVTGGNGTPPASTKVGQKCSGSACKKAGYNKKTHKFDGSFFGQ